MARITHLGVVYPWDCDHMGHMNVSAYVLRIDQANWTLFATVGMDRAYLEGAGRLLAGVDQHLVYRRELLPGDVFRVRSRFVSVGESSVTVQHEMELHDGTSVATCELVGVHLDRATRRSAPLPDEIRSRIRAAIDGRDTAP